MVESGTINKELEPSKNEKYFNMNFNGLLEVSFKNIEKFDIIVTCGNL